MGFFDELVKAKGMFEMVAVLYEYRYPILIIVGILATIIFIRSYIHGREIKKLKKGMVGNLGQGGASNTFHNCQDIKILQATPDVARILMGGQQIPRLPQPKPQAPPGKRICPHCNSINPKDFIICDNCEGQICTDAELAVIQSKERRRIEEAERIRREAEEEKHKRWKAEHKKEKKDRDFELVTGHPPKNPESARYKKSAEVERQKVLREQAIEKEKQRLAAQAKYADRLARGREFIDKLTKEREEKRKETEEKRKAANRELAKNVAILVALAIPFIVITVSEYIVKGIRLAVKGVRYIRSRIQARKAMKQKEVESSLLQVPADKMFSTLNFNCHQDPSDVDMCLHCDQAFTKPNRPAASAETDVTPTATSNTSVYKDQLKDRVDTDELN